MTTKGFKRFASFIGIILLLLSVFFSLILVLFSIAYFTKKTGFSINPPTNGFTLFHAGMNSPTHQDKLLAGFVVTVPTLITYIFLFFKGSQFFKSLVQDETPFSKENQQMMSRTGIILMILGVLPSIIYSIILSSLMTNGYNFNVTIDSNFLIGAVIYSMSKIISYGVELQEFSDEVV